MAKPKRTAKAAGPAHAGVSEEDVRAAVRERYAELASGGSCCGGNSRTMCHCGDLYPAAEVLSLPADAVAVSAGCGNPTAIAGLKSGMTVVDLGSGGGIDAFLAAKKVGSKGKVYGIDATPEMVHRARRAAKANGYANVEFRLGEIEHIPLDDKTADVVISNCVINLSPDKGQVFREAFRILKPGGRLAVSDIVLLRDLPDGIKEDLGSWTECVSGAVMEDVYIGAMKRAGFTKVNVEERAVYTHEQMLSYLGDSIVSESVKATAIDLSQLIASYKIRAIRPSK